MLGRSTSFALHVTVVPCMLGWNFSSLSYQSSLCSLSTACISPILFRERITHLYPSASHKHTPFFFLREWILKDSVILNSKLFRVKKEVLLLDRAFEMTVLAKSREWHWIKGKQFLVECFKTNSCIHLIPVFILYPAERIVC